MSESTILSYFKNAISALRDVSRSNDSALGGRGTFRLNFTGTKILKDYGGIKADYIISTDDATAFSVLVDSEGEDILTYSGLGSDVLKAGFIWRAKDGRTIIAAELSAGSAIAVKTLK